MRKDEEKIQIQLSDYIKMQYPNVIFTFEASGLRLPIGLAKKAKRMRSGRGLPDMLILEPKGGYYGLLIEIKVNRSDVYLNDGKTLRKLEHIKEQSEILDRLDNKGYWTTFGFGFDECKELLDWYLE